MQESKKTLNITLEDLDFYYSKTIKDHLNINTTDGSTRLLSNLPTESTKTANDNVWINTSDTSIYFKVGTDTYKLTGTLVQS